MRRTFIKLGNAHADRMAPKDVIRFLRFVKLDPVAGCWLWTGAPDENGYGRFKIGGKVRWAHRLAYVNFRCALRAGNDVHHIEKCKSRSCVNPEHLAQKSRDWNSINGTHRRKAQAKAAAKHAVASSPPPF